MIGEGEETEGGLLVSLAPAWGFAHVGFCTRGVLHTWGAAVPLYPRSCWLHSLPSPSPEMVTTLASSSVKGGGEGQEQLPSLAWWVEWGGSRGRDTVLLLLVS